MKTSTAIFTPEPLIKARESRSLTQKELGATLKVRQSTISDIENGRRKPSLPLLYRLCQYLNLEMTSLFLETFNDNSDNAIDKYR